jgi:hypothetical protein
MTCPAGPLPSNEWTVWLGPVPSQLTQFAVKDLAQEAQEPYGYEWTTTYDGQQVMAIKQHHTWTYHNGKLVTGICIPGITLYRPKKVGVEETPVDLGVPNNDVAWFDEGPGVSWTSVAWTAAAAAIVIALFFLAIRKMGKKPVK